MKVVLDASAVGKWYLIEEESKDMRKLRDEILIGEVEAHVPELMLIELANLLRYARGLSPEDVVKGVRAAMSIGLIMHRFDELLEKAVEIAFKESLTVYDSTYVALTENLNAMLITYDDRLLKNVKRACKASEILSRLNSL
jgi:predicted nucleic acid-binding protein